MLLTPGAVTAWLIAGLVAGWAAGKVSRSHAFGIIGDLTVGLIGSLLGGLVADAFLPDTAEVVFTIAAAFGTAALLLGLIRLLGGRRETV